MLGMKDTRFNRLKKGDKIVQKNKSDWEADTTYIVTDIEMGEYKIIVDVDTGETRRLYRQEGRGSTIRIVPGSTVEEVAKEVVEAMDEKYDIGGIDLKIEAIKEVRARHKDAGLKDAKDAVEKFMDE